MAPAQAGTPWTLEQARAFAAAEVKIERLRKQKPADWQSISEWVDVTMPIVKAVDKIKGAKYAVAIPLALAECTSRKNAPVAQQVIGKGLQHIAVLAIGLCLDEAAKGTDAEAEIYVQEAAALFEGIRPTFVRRDSDFFGAETTLGKTADRAFARLMKSGKQGLFSARRSLNDIINRTYALCVYFEISGIEKLHQTDLPQCAKKLKEAEIFYRIIQNTVKRRSPSANQAILAMLKMNFDSMSAAEIEKLLIKGLGKPFLPKGK